MGKCDDTVTPTVRLGSVAVHDHDWGPDGTPTYALGSEAGLGLREFDAESTCSSASTACTLANGDSEVDEAVHMPQSSTEPWAGSAVAAPDRGGAKGAAAVAASLGADPPLGEDVSPPPGLFLPAVRSIGVPQRHRPQLRPVRNTDPLVPAPSAEGLSPGQRIDVRSSRNDIGNIWSSNKRGRARKKLGRTRHEATQGTIHLIMNDGPCYITGVFEKEGETERVPQSVAVAADESARRPNASGTTKTRATRRGKGWRN